MKTFSFVFFRVLTWSLLLFAFVWGCKKGGDSPDPQTPDGTLSEAAKSRTGLLLIQQEEYEKIPIYVPKSGTNNRVAAELATAIELEMPPVANQGFQGSCTAFASAYALRSYLYYDEKNVPYTNADGTGNDNVLFSPAYVYNQINGGRDEGSYPSDALDLMTTEGVCPWNEMPYDDRDYRTKPTTAQKGKAASYRLTGWGRTIISVDNLKQCISSGLPVVFAISMAGYLPENIKQIGPDKIWYRHGGFSNWDSPHAMVITGFDDAKNAFKVMNSWGKEWGNNGYTWMDYSLVEDGVFMAYIAFNAKRADKVTGFTSIEYTGSGSWNPVSSPDAFDLMEGYHFTVNGKFYCFGNR